MQRATRLSVSLALFGLLLAGTGTAAADPVVGTDGAGTSSATYTTARVVVPIVFPVIGPTSLTDTFLACRSGCARRHLGQDLMGPKMSPLVAAFDGVVTSLRRQVSPGGGNYLVISADRGPAAGWSAVYVHVNDDTPGTEDGKGTALWSFPSGVAPGVRVLAGQLVGWRGNSGDAERTAPHLHFELRHGTGWDGVVYNAYPSLLAARHLARPAPSGPHPDGTLLRAPDGRLSLLDGGVARPVSDAVLAADGLDPRTAVPVGAAELAGYRPGGPLPLRDGTLVRGPDGREWLVSGRSRAALAHGDLAALGWTAPRVWPVAAADLDPLTVVTAVPARPVPGSVVREQGTAAVSWVDPSGVPRHVDPAVFASFGWTPRDVAVVPAGTLTGGPPPAEPLGLRDGTLVQTGSHRVGVTSGGQLHRLRDSREVAAYAYRGLPRLLLDDSEVAGLTESELSPA